MATYELSVIPGLTITSNIKIVKAILTLTGFGLNESKYMADKICEGETQKIYTNLESTATRLFLQQVKLFTDNNIQCVSKTPHLVSKVNETSDNPEVNKSYYVCKKGKVCPFCRSTDILTLSDLKIKGIKVYQDVACDDCGKTWRDVYTLTGYDVI